MTVTAALVMLLAAGFGGFGWLAIALITGQVSLPDRPPGGARLRRISDGNGRQLLGAGAAGVLVLLVTGWVAVAVAAGLMVISWPKMFGAAKQQQVIIGRLEALATWVESLRDTIATGTALPEAIPITARDAPAVLQRPLQDLVARMQAREPLDQALLALADDLDDAVGDSVVGALALNARAQGRQLKVVLSSLAEATRKQVDVRREVEAGRRSLRQSVRIIMIVTAAFVTGLAVFNQSYVEPYGTVTGQLVLAMAVGCFAAAFIWMHRLSSFDVPSRFLTGGGFREEPGSVRIPQPTRPMVGRS